MKVIVLGAGITGTATAWFLMKAGHEVTVLDRATGPARETTFANGGQISVSHATPWATPSAPKQFLQSLRKDDAPLLYRFRPDWQQLRWSWRFLRECTASRMEANTRQIVAMAEFSRQTLLELREETGISYDHLGHGIVHFYTNEKDLAQAEKTSALMRGLGVERHMISRDDVIHLEPALASIEDSIVGGDYTPTDESGDAFTFTASLTNKAVEEGVVFLYNTTVTRLLAEDTGNLRYIRAVETINQQGKYELLEADAFVVCLGCESAPLLEPHGVKLMIYPGKGYSATYEITRPELAPRVSLTDETNKLVFSRLGNRLRVAGTCEFNGYSRELNPTRCTALTKRTRELFPDACDYARPQYWAGLRPMTPSNIPYIGRTALSNLYLNTGHGSLGWTMGCGSGLAIANIISGQRAGVKFAFT